MARHEETLRRIFATPPPRTMPWRDIVALLRWLGATLAEGAGSRVRIEIDGQAITVHSPHPQKEARQPLIRDIRLLLERAGIAP